MVFVQQQRGQTGDFLAVTSIEGVTAPSESNQMLLPVIPANRVFVGPVTAHRGVNIHAFQFGRVVVRSWTEREGDEFAIREPAGDGLPLVWLNLNEQMFVIIELPLLYVRFGNVFLFEYFRIFPLVLRRNCRNHSITEGDAVGARINWPTCRSAIPNTPGWCRHWIPQIPNQSAGNQNADPTCPHRITPELRGEV